jgi:hypothetical protein
MDHDSDLKRRLDEAFFGISQMRPDMRDDLRRMWRQAREIWTQMDPEMVNCRRLHKLTPQYQLLETLFVDSLNTVEQYIAWGTLLG